MLIDSTAAQFDRLPPHSIEAEMCLLASIMLDVTHILPVKAMLSGDEFFQADHQVLFKTVVDLHEAGRAVDAVLVMENLKKRQLLAEIGGRDYILKLLESVPSAAHAIHYAGIVREKHFLRRLICIANDALRDAFAPQTDAGAVELAGRAIKALDAIGAAGMTHTIATIGDVVHEVYDSLEGNAPSMKLPTNIGSIDEVAGGLFVGGHNLIGGRPGMGKSAMGKQIMVNLARNGFRSGLITVEENNAKVGRNILSNQTLIENRLLGLGDQSKINMPALGLGVDKVARLPIHICDSPVKLRDICEVARRMVEVHGCQAIFVDHLHLVELGEPVDGREQELTRISKQLKNLWKRLKVAGVVMCQLNRADKQNRAKIPEMPDLRGSGSLEADGDLILMLHRPDEYRENKASDPLEHKIWINVAKNKDGPTALRPAYCCMEHQRITDPPSRDWQQSPKCICAGDGAEEARTSAFD